MKTRDYSNLYETERVHDAVKLNNTYIKDYSMEHICKVLWHQTDDDRVQRIAHLVFGDVRIPIEVLDVRYEIEKLVDEADENGWLPRKGIRLGQLTISTREVNKDCLQDHIASITIKDRTALIDLEELLKAIRYT